MFRRKVLLSSGLSKNPNKKIKEAGRKEIEGRWENPV
jgi:hypothetical protein